jgi:hypothetical protein
VLLLLCILYSVLISLVNSAILGALGYVAYSNWNKSWDRRAVSAISVGLLTIWGGEGYALTDLIFLRSLTLIIQNTCQQVIKPEVNCIKYYVIIIMALAGNFSQIDCSLIKYLHVSFFQASRRFRLGLVRVGG